jgi:hypothetical protein
LSSISRRTYASLFGPTTGDRVRLADTNLVLRIERDHAVYGEESVFGGGKSIRDGMAQSASARQQGIDCCGLQASMGGWLRSWQGNNDACRDWRDIGCWCGNCLRYSNAPRQRATGH